MDSHRSASLTEELGGEREGDVDSVRKVVTASVIGTAIEWYDFFLYATAAALVFNELFFPSSEPLTGTLAAFATYAVGFAVRPIGGIVFGHLGDKIGRKAVLVSTLLLMGTSTFLIGCLPTFDAIGVWAPVLLVLLRMVQGFGAGAEFTGAILMVVERTPAHRRGFFGSWPQTGVALGLIAATGMFALVATLPAAQLNSWGWRIPFLLSGAIVGVGLYIRLRLLETPAFRELKAQHEVAKAPVLEVIRTAPKSLLAVMGARFADNAVLYVGSAFVLAYAVEALELPKTVALYGVLIASAIQIALIPVFGALSDRIGRRPVYAGGAAFSMLFAFPFFWLLDTESTALIWLAIALLVGVAYAAMAGSQPAFFSELFETRVRYSGIALARETTAVLGGASPLIATALLAAGAVWGIGAFLAGMCAVTVISVLLTPETSGRRPAASSGAGAARPAAARPPSAPAPVPVGARGVRDAEH
jgi:MFS transporter, MHS family, shikimate and dehydroshikimate transport protein